MSLVKRIEKELFTVYIPWMIYLGLMIWIEISITGTLSNAILEFREVYEQAAIVYVDLVIPFILISGILLNTVSFLTRRTWIAYFSVFLVMLVSFVIYYGLTYQHLTANVIPYSYFSMVVSNIFLDLFIALIPTILFTYILNLLSLDRKKTEIKVKRRILIPVDLSISIIVTIGLALFTLYLSQLFSVAFEETARLAPVELRELISNFISTNLGQFIIILSFLSFITYIIYGLVEPLTIYIGGLKGQARDILKYEYEKISKKDFKLLRPSITYVLIRGLPYLGFTLLVFTYNYLYLNNLLIQFQSGNIIELAIKMFTIYFEDLSSLTHNAPVTVGDINLISVIDWKELEVYMEMIRALIRFLFRLIFNL